ncbi:MAG: formimidoylglutamase [Propionibacteriaceae bacterium]|nr:formimidoylglutamase [Propionibacteriaceae bacterium]
MIWTGRTDGDGPEHARWHQRISTDAPTGQHVSLLGFASDEGVRRNHGRQGAAAAPVELRRALASMALHRSLAGGTVGLHDLGDVAVEGEDLEAGQAAMGDRIGDALAADGNVLTVVLGGGHETAWASYLGLTASEVVSGQRWGVLNLDAHFDLRSAERPTSGTPFQQMALAQSAAGEAFRYGVIGIAEPSNTGALFRRADELDVDYLFDVDCSTQRVTEFAENFIAGLDAVYLTIDLDVLPASVAPGVSAPASLGVPARAIVGAVRAVASSGKLRLMDVVELNPKFDVDGRTAKLGARLISEATACLPQVRPPKLASQRH